MGISEMFAVLIGCVFVNNYVLAHFVGFESIGADSSKDLFVLHEGTKVVKTDEVGEWISIEIADGRRGWLPAKALETI